MLSKIYSIVNDPTTTDQQKIDALVARISQQNTKYLAIRNALAKSEINLNKIMDANGSNKEEHYAKTMMFYGRKFCGSDVLHGIHDSTTNDRYHYDSNGQAGLSDVSPYIGDFDGMDVIIPALDGGTFKITWDCMDGVDGTTAQSLDIYRDTYAPAVTTIDQYHVVGSHVIMPTIKNMDATNPGFGAGTNTYRLKNGYAIMGWKIKANMTTSGTGKVYLLDSNGIEYKKQTTHSTTGQATTSNVLDIRVFGFDDAHPAAQDTDAAAATSGCSNAFTLPFNLSLSPVFPREIKFVLSVVPTWFTIQFVVPHGDGPDTAPWKKTIKAMLGMTITLPQASQITPSQNWDVDRSQNPAGTWTTVNPSTGATDLDPWDDPIPSLELFPSTPYIVGTDIDAGCKKVGAGGAAQTELIKYLYLEMVQNI